MDDPKTALLCSLPITVDDLTLRPCRREDLDRLAEWPPYPFPYERFTLYYAQMTPDERERHFHRRSDDPSRIELVVDWDSERAVAWLALVDIDWDVRAVGNMGFRVRPTHTDRGLGTEILNAVTRWCRSRGLDTLRLDVAASNPRAVRCYEKTGFRITAEFWRDAEELLDIDLDDPKYAFLRPHVRIVETIPQVRFWWMERTVES